MTLNILAADDSVTMRRILEHTFAGEDANVITVDNGDACITKASQLQPDVIFADATMPTDGYAVARAVRSTAGLERTAIIVMASERHPYDEAKGRAAGVDDHVLKPFDTQQLIERVQKVLSQPRATAGAAPSTPQPFAPPRAPTPAPLPAMQAPEPLAAGPRGPKTHTIAFGMPQISPLGHGLPSPALKPPGALPMPMAPAVQPMQRVSAPYAETPAPPPAAPARFSMPEPLPRISAPAPEPLARKSMPRPEAWSRSSTEPLGSAAAGAVTRDLAERLSDLRLTPEQIDGVLELSRAVIERVVWEVVPDLAETIIREEIRRLTQ